MRDHGPSRTAIVVAILRAAHQLVDSPLIFEDPLALQILPYVLYFDVEKNSCPESLQMDTIPSDIHQDGRVSEGISEPTY